MGARGAIRDAGRFATVSVDAVRDYWNRRPCNVRHSQKPVGTREHFDHDGSVLKLMLYHRRSWKVLWILLTEGRGRFWKLDEVVARNSEAQTGCPITYTYTRRGARNLLAGFHIEESRVDFIFPYRLRDYV